MTEADLEAGGWKRLPGVRYTAALGPTWMKVTDGQPTVALQACEHLGNDNFGIVHGGAMMTFADIALGCGVGRLTGADHFVTLQMQLQFAAAANVGDFVTCNPEIVRETSSIVFARGLITVGSKTVASADGIFKKVDPEKMRSRVKAG